MLVQASWPNNPVAGAYSRPVPGGAIKSQVGAGRVGTGQSGAGPVGTVMTFTRDAEIYGEGEPAEFLYEVLSGAVRTCKILTDGRRQIGDFYLPGDTFGLEGAGEHLYSAEALASCRIVATRRRTFDAMAARDGCDRLLKVAAQALRRAQSHALLLVRSAPERVAGFLLDMSARASAPEFDLPMSRQDIADYLGVTIETVSRTMTGFEASGFIALPSARRVVLRNRGGLLRLNT